MAAIATELDFPVSRIEAEVRAYAGAAGKKPVRRGARRRAKSLREEVPENRDVLYMIAVSQRYLQRIPEALATLERFERLHPDYSRLYQERGHCYVALREAAPAIEAFLRAVNINPALPASWKALEVLYRMTGHATEAETAAAHVATLAKLPAEVVTATSMFADGEIFRGRAARCAIICCGTAITSRPCACWPRSAWSSTCWTMRNCCSRAC